MSDSSTSSDDNEHQSIINDFSSSAPAKKRKLSMNEMSSSSIELQAERVKQHVNGSNKSKILEVEDTVAKLQAKNVEEKRQHKTEMDSIIKEYNAKIKAYEAEKHKSESRFKELSDQVALMVKTETQKFIKAVSEAVQNETDKFKADINGLKRQLSASESKSKKMEKKYSETVAANQRLEQRCKELEATINNQSMPLSESTIEDLKIICQTFEQPATDEPQLSEQPATEESQPSEAAPAAEPCSLEKDTAKWLETQPKLNVKTKSGYILFAAEVRRRVMAENPDSSFGEISRIVGDEWTKLNVEQKLQYGFRAQQIAQERAKNDLLTPNSKILQPGQVRVYQCKWSACHFQFDCQDGLYEHIKTSHTSKIVDGKNQNECLWQLCFKYRKEGKPFLSLPRLHRHLRERHVQHSSKVMLPNQRSMHYFVYKAPDESAPDVKDQASSGHFINYQFGIVNPNAPVFAIGTPLEAVFKIHKAS